jgi:ectoine hydroxylase-related dioxygenase (phytanoyl-CoA dioxygenase family)
MVTAPNQNVESIAPSLLSDFARDGFAVMPDVLSNDVLAMLRKECMQALSTSEAGHRNPSLSRDRRVFAFNCQRRQPRLADYLFGNQMAEICRAFLGENAYFFLDQFVVKAPRVGGSFGWHQDSGYVVSYGGPTDHAPFLSIWAPLDDATVANGTLLVQPGSHLLGIQPHLKDDERSQYCTECDDAGTPIELAAGGLVVFSSLLIHSTGVNNSDDARRAYLAQYTSEVMIDPGGRQLRRNAIPLIRDGRRATVR